MSRVGAYEPLRFYDKPDVIASQLLEGELTWDSLRRTLFNPESLSPAERTGLSDMILGGREGTGAVERAVVGVLTNPLVWAGILVGPVGRKALAEGKGLFSVKRALSSQMKEKLPFMHHFRSPSEELLGSSAVEISAEVSIRAAERMEKHLADLSRAQKPLLARMSRSIGVPDISQRMLPGAFDPLSPDSYLKGSDEWRTVARFVKAERALAHRYAGGNKVPLVTSKKRVVFRRPGSEVWEDLEIETNAIGEVGSNVRVTAAMEDQLKETAKQYEENVLLPQWKEMDWRQKERYGGFRDYANQKGWGIRSSIKNETVPDGVEIPNVIDADWANGVLQEYGDEATEYLSQVDRTQKLAFVEALGDEEHFLKTEKFRPDRRKVEGLAASMRREVGGPQDQRLQRGPTSLQGKEALMSQLDPEIYQRWMDLDEKQFLGDKILEDLEQIVTPQRWGTRWASRNLWDVQPIWQNGMKRRPPTGDPSQVENLFHAPWATAGVVADSVAPLTAKQHMLHVDELEFFAEEGALTDAGRKMLLEARQSAFDAWNRGNGKVVMGLRLDTNESARKAMMDLVHLRTYDTTAASESMMAADKLARRNVSDVVGISGRKTKSGKGRDVHVMEDFAPDEFVSPGMLMDRAVAMEQSVDRQNFIREFAVPNVINNAGAETQAMVVSQMQAKATARWLAGSWIGRVMEKSGQWGARTVERLREVGDPYRRALPSDWQGGVTKWLYSTHLGLNVSSVVLNMTQPLLLASTIGTTPQIARAYGEAFKEMGEYASRRSKLGFVVSPEDKLKVMRESFSDFDTLGIGPNVYDIVDFGLRGRKVTNKVEDVMLGMFEKSEWMNRIVSAKILKAVRTDLGQAVDAGEVRRFVEQVQFAASRMNTPVIFQKGPLASPLLRMFMTFPLRSFVSAVDTFPKLGEMDRMEGLLKVTLRGLGTSAMIYEVGKGLMGADLSRGLYAASATDLFGGERMLRDGNEWVPVPPALDLPMDLIRAFATEDARLLSDSVARLVPAGVAINRALGAAPEATGIFGVVGGLQKTYAGWNQPTPEGLVPVFKADGTLLDYRKPSELVLRGLGADLGDFGEEGSLDNYLVKQREQILQHRHEAMRALVAGDVAKLEQVQAEFLRRFKVPLTITREQVRAHLRSKITGRTERVLDRLPEEVRGQYARMVAGAGAEPQLAPGALEGGGSSRDRDRFRPTGDVDPAVVEELVRRAQGTQPKQSQPFAPYASF